MHSSSPVTLCRMIVAKVSFIVGVWDRWPCPQATSSSVHCATTQINSASACAKRGSTCRTGMPAGSWRTTPLTNCTPRTTHVRLPSAIASRAVSSTLCTDSPLWVVVLVELAPFIASAARRLTLYARSVRVYSQPTIQTRARTRTRSPTLCCRIWLQPRKLLLRLRETMDRHRESHQCVDQHGKAFSGMQTHRTRAPVPLSCEIDARA